MANITIDKMYPLLLSHSLYPIVPQSGLLYVFASSAVGQEELASFLMHSKVVEPTALAEETSVPSAVVSSKNLNLRAALGSSSLPLTENSTLLAIISTFNV